MVKVLFKNVGGISVDDLSVVNFLEMYSFIMVSGDM